MGDCVAHRSVTKRQTTHTVAECSIKGKQWVCKGDLPDTPVGNIWHHQMDNFIGQPVCIRDTPARRDTSCLFTYICPTENKKLMIISFKLVPSLYLLTVLTMGLYFLFIFANISAEATFL